LDLDKPHKKLYKVRKKACIVQDIKAAASLALSSNFIEILDINWEF